ncbi:MAG TPA: SagB/ThcOx family dehydrogenase, partial [Planctomycetota bacterium]|nr:SagB/ThcOx family dehydrogenase [Planctomycetota bacterium]
DGAELAAAGGSAPPQPALSPRAGTPNLLSPEERPHPLIDGMHLSTFVDGGPCPPAPEPAPEPGDGLALPEAVPASEPLHRSVRRRRSALDYLPEARASLQDFAGILRESAVLPRCDFLGSLSGAAPRRLVDLHCFIHRVDDLAPGCYRYLPGRHALLAVRLGDVRAAAAGLSLGQELAGHAVAAFSMIADLGRGARTFGNRAYRHAHVEAGMVGQGLYLAATARGLDATGIGAFYDDDVHRWLGLVGRERQVIYHHSIGKAVVDPRLVDSDRPAEVRDVG